MALTGYAGKPLYKKLGLDPTTKLLLINQPPGYSEMLGSDVSQWLCAKNETPGMVHLFVRTSGELKTALKKLHAVIRKNTAVVIWVSWYKKAAKIPTDVTEDIIRELALQHGLVDIKVCAVNEIWSGLKLVVPLHKR